MLPLAATSAIFVLGPGNTASQPPQALDVEGQSHGKHTYQSHTRVKSSQSGACHRQDAPLCLTIFHGPQDHESSQRTRRAGFATVSSCPSAASFASDTSRTFPARGPEARKKPRASKPPGAPRGRRWGVIVHRLHQSGMGSEAKQSQPACIRDGCVAPLLARS
jgi:hypothetical protein